MGVYLWYVICSYLHSAKVLINVVILQDKWKIRIQLMKPVTWPPLVWGVVCGAAASGNLYHFLAVELGGIGNLEVVLLLDSLKQGWHWDQCITAVQSVDS